MYQNEWVKVSYITKYVNAYLLYERAMLAPAIGNPHSSMYGEFNPEFNSTTDTLKRYLEVAEDQRAFQILEFRTTFKCDLIMGVRVRKAETEMHIAWEGTELGQAAKYAYHNLPGLYVFAPRIVGNIADIAQARLITVDCIPLRKQTEI